MSESAPSFRLPSDDGTTVTSASLKGRWYVIYFYPKDDTPGCTREAQAFTAAAKQFAKRDVPVYGVSRDSVERHQKFRAKYALGIPLLSDADAAVHKAYGAFGEKKLYGKVSEGALRTTLIVDPKGKIAKRYAGVKVDGHVDAVLRDLDALLDPSSAPATPAPAKKAAAKKAPAAKAPAVTKTVKKAEKPIVKKR